MRPKAPPIQLSARRPKPLKIPSAITGQNISKSSRAQEVLSDVSFDIDVGEILVVLGRSASLQD